MLPVTRLLVGAVFEAQFPNGKIGVIKRSLIRDPSVQFSSSELAINKLLAEDEVFSDKVPRFMGHFVVRAEKLTKLELTIQRERKAKHASFSVWPNPAYFHCLMFEKFGISLQSFLTIRKPSVEQVRSLSHQLLTAVHALHQKHIVHRDIKPGNLLVDPDTLELRICDLGSAKIITPSDTAESMPYICTRYYRAPELLMGCTSYNGAIDIWSVGCVIAEMFTGRPLFCGERSDGEELALIFSACGLPDMELMRALRVPTEIAEAFGEELEASSPRDKHQSLLWMILRREGDGIPEDAIDVLCSILQLDPAKRPSIEEILSHGFFDGPGQEEALSPAGDPGVDGRAYNIDFTSDEEMDVAE